MLVGDDVADRASEHRARPAEGDVADELLPDETVDVVVGADGEAAPAARRRATVSILGVTGPERSPSRTSSMPWWWTWPGATTEAPKPPTTPTATRSSPSTAAAASGPPRPFWIESTSVAGPTSGRALSAAAVASIAFVASTTSSASPASAGSVVASIRTVRSPLAPSTRSPRVTDRLDQVLAAVDRPDLVAGTRQEPGVHRAHRAGADDRDLHRANSRTGPAGRAPDRGRATRPRAAARPAVP